MIDEYSYILENLVTVFIMVHVGIYVCVMKHFVVVRKIVCIHQIEIICDKPALVLNDTVLEIYTKDFFFHSLCSIEYYFILVGWYYTR